MRTKKLLASMAIIVVLAGGCSALTGRTMGRWADDHSISSKVKAKLASLRSGPANPINVDTYNGTVYLSGIVESEDTKWRAEALAWSVEDVEQVVPNVQVRRAASYVSASPATIFRTAADTEDGPWQPLLTKIPGLDHITGDGVASPHGPFTAYDRAGHLVATVYTISMRDLAQRGLDDLEASGRRIDHVTIYSIAGHPDVPDPQYQVVLWHVSRAEEARLR